MSSVAVGASALAYLFITHNIGVGEYIADQMAVMQAGRTVELDAGEAILQRSQDEYTRTLLAAVPRLAGCTAAPGASG